MSRQLLPAAPRSMAEFEGRNGRFDGDGRAVHSVAPQPWIGDLQVPGPACRTPNGSFDPATFNPVQAAVSCRRCLRSPAAAAAAAPPVDPNQGVLALPDIPGEVA
jgi:hypothetical protein